MIPPLKYDDFKKGMKIISQGITLSETHIVQFAELTGDYNPIHMDDEFSKNTIFGVRISHGLLTTSLGLGLFFQLVMGTVIALLEVNVKFLKPVKKGDTIHTETEVKDKKESKKYNGGVVTFEHKIKNQAGEEVAIAETKLLISNGLVTKENVIRH